MFDVINKTDQSYKILDKLFTLKIFKIKNKLPSKTGQENGYLFPNIIGTRYYIKIKFCNFYKNNYFGVNVL